MHISRKVYTLYQFSKAYMKCRLKYESIPIDDWFMLTTEARYFPSLKNNSRCILKFTNYRLIFSLKEYSRRINL